jgi:hypothetical protein
VWTGADGAALAIFNLSFDLKRDPTPDRLQGRNDIAFITALVDKC